MVTASISPTVFVPAYANGRRKPRLDRTARIAISLAEIVVKLLLYALVEIGVKLWLNALVEIGIKL